MIRCVQLPDQNCERFLIEICSFRVMMSWPFCVTLETAATKWNQKLRFNQDKFLRSQPIKTKKASSERVEVIPVERWNNSCRFQRSCNENSEITSNNVVRYLLSGFSCGQYTVSRFKSNKRRESCFWITCLLPQVCYLRFTNRIRGGLNMSL